MERVTVRVPIGGVNRGAENLFPVGSETSGGLSARFEGRGRGETGHLGMYSSTRPVDVSKSASTRKRRRSGKEKERRSGTEQGVIRNRFPFFRKKMADTDHTVDPRIAERARRIRDKEEKKAFKRAVWLLGLMTVVGIGIWITYSPYLTVARVLISGHSASSALQHIEGAGIRKGVPMVSINEEEVQQALLSDPWVAQAEVVKEWPETVRVAIQERYPVAWALTGQGWRAVSLDGVALDVDSEELFPHVTGIAGVPLELSDPVLKSALVFLDHLRSDLRFGTVLEIHGEQVTAEVAGRIARLGRAVDLEEKADVLSALIDYHTDPGSVINLFSARRPAVYRSVSSEIVIASPSS
jgi:hypothetical protein